MEIPIESPHQDNIKIHCIFAASTQTWSFIIADKVSLHAIIIDPLLSRESSTNAISTTAADAILAIILAKNYTIDHILETNPSEEYTSATWYLRTQILEAHGKAPRIAVRESLKGVQRVYARKYGVRKKFWKGEFDGKFVDGEVLNAGNLRIKVLHLPGRSIDHVGYVIGDHIFMGECCSHTPRRLMGCDDGEGRLHGALRMSRNRLMDLQGSLRISTSRGCPARERGKGCIGEMRDEHAKEVDAPEVTFAGGLDEGLVA